jgi:hypothetical protein
MLRKHPGMGEALEMPPGVYRAEFFEFDYGDDFAENLLQQRTSPAQFRAYTLLNHYLAPFGCMAFLALVGSWFTLPWPHWAVVAFPLGLLLIAPLILSQLPIYREAYTAYKRVARDFPAYGVVLQPAGEHPGATTSSDRKYP